ARNSPSRTEIAPEMTILRPLSILLSCLLLAEGARAQVPPTPPAAQTPAAPEKRAKSAAPAKKPSDAKSKAGAPAATATPAPATDDPNADMVYGAYQRGFYKTAFDLAAQRAAAGDTKAMTMLGELYANAMGVKRDDAKAAEWYKRAADG